jgi:hypothetical protein
LGQISIVDWKAAPPFFLVYSLSLSLCIVESVFGDDGE